ncbi:hypothetical protein ALC53_02150 [Atta colombica]|uniref:Uncharacterized protein n=1 Tax=Atta colombica TaxID=520822 RepID=A0A195BT34_9HYME|nr:hypothetical protein ALC53_02150 [Atta colombica]
MSDKDRSSPTLVENSLKSLLDQPSIFPLIGKCCSPVRADCARVILRVRIYTRDRTTLIWHAKRTALHALALRSYMHSPKRTLLGQLGFRVASSPRSFHLSSSVPRRSSLDGICPAVFHLGGSARVVSPKDSRRRSLVAQRVIFFVVRIQYL